MSLVRNIKKRTQRRATRVREALKEVSSLPRVSVHRTLKQIYAQVIDDVAHKTLVSCSTLELKDLSGDKKARAHAVGVELAKRAKQQGLDAVVFDRGSFLYHGRVKALAEGLREGGLKV